VAEESPPGQHLVDNFPVLTARRRGVAELRVLLTALLVFSLIMFDSSIVAVSRPSIGRSLGACFDDVQWVISAYVISERETAPMHAKAPTKMPCKLNRLPRPALTGPAKSPVKI
jgi:hypothetical protein